MARNKRTYTDDEIAHAVALLGANGGNAKRTARELGVSRTTLRGWAGRQHPTNGTPKAPAPSAVSEKSEQLAQTLEEISARASAKVLSALDHLEVKSAQDVRNLLVGVGITTEKASFARGGPTTRSEQVKVALADPSSLKNMGLRVLRGGKEKSA